MPSKVSEVLDKLEGLERGLLLRLEGLEKKLEGLLNSPVHKSNVVAEPVVDVPVPSIELQFPVPLEYRQVVNDTLNSNFGVKIEYEKDKPAFIFTIIVPDKYSNMPPSQRESQKVDLRSKVIFNHEGTLGVKQWAELVFKNFDLVTQTNIVNDRNNG